MKTIVIVSTALLALNAFATVRNSEGFSTADPMFMSDDAYVTISGDSAKELYHHLKLPADQFGATKSGKNITCREVAFYGSGKPGKTEYECLMLILADGTVLSPR